MHKQRIRKALKLARKFFNSPIYKSDKSLTDYNDYVMNKIMVRSKFV